MDIKLLSKKYLVTRGEGDAEEKIIIEYKSSGEIERIILRQSSNSDLLNVAKKAIKEINLLLFKSEQSTIDFIVNITKIS